MPRVTFALPPIQIGIGCCTGQRPPDALDRLEVPALVAERLAAPVQRQHVERLVEQVVALFDVDAERAELALQVAGTDAEDESSA